MIKCAAFLAFSALAAATPARAHGPSDPARQAAERALFEKLVELPTVAGRTGAFREMTALLRQEFARAGIRDVVVKDHDDTQTLIARWPAARPDGRKPVLLMAHMDVVDANPADWQNPPFEFRTEDGHYLGRGTHDNKAALTAIVLALQHLAGTGFEPSRDIIVLFTGDEETTGRGAHLAATEWRDLIDAEYALNGDAGGGELYPDGRVFAFGMQVAEKTVADYTLVATNRGGHSSAPRPDNAINALAWALVQIERHRFEPRINEASRIAYQQLAEEDGGQFGELIRKFLADPSDREVADLLEANDAGHTRTRCVATRLAAGHANNALPQRAEANVNCRLFPGDKLEDVRSTLQGLAGPDVTVSIADNPGVPSDPSPVRKELVDAFKAALAPRFGDAPVLPFMSAGATDGAYLRNAGIPVYGFGGLWDYSGEKYGLHGLDERVRVDAFHDQVPIWAAMLREVAGR